MKIKTFLFISAVMLITATQSIFAQTSSNKTKDDVTLNIKLHKIQSLVVNTGQKTVNLEYKEIGDYASGVTSDQNDHLEVFSTGGFKITAKTSENTLNGVNGNDKTIDAKDIHLLASKGSGNNLSSLTMASTSLSNVDKDIVSSNGGGRALKFNVQYKTQHTTDAYINHYRNSENPTIYTTTVTYTIAPI